MQIRVNSTVLLVFASTLFCSCQMNNEDQMDKLAPDLEFSSPVSDSSGANYYKSDRALAHKASIEVEVANCVNTINRIEEKVASLKGFILNSNYAEQIIKLETAEVSSDSMLQLKQYQNTANLIVRVPDSSLQLFLLHVQQISSNIRVRTIEAEDMSLTGASLKIQETKNGSSEQPTVASLSSADRRDLLDYCTVSITAAEPQKVSKFMVANTNSFYSSRPSLINSCWVSIQKGYFYVAQVFVFFLQFWFMLPVLILLRWAFIRTKKSHKTPIASKEGNVPMQTTENAD